MLLDHEIDQHFKEGNLIRFDSDGNRFPFKENILDADTPELTLAPTGFPVASLHHASNVSRITQSYTWIIVSGDYRVRIVNEVAFAIIRASLEWAKSGYLTSLLWEDQNYVKDYRLLPAEQGDTDPELNRGIRGWTVLFGVEVDMFFQTSLLRVGV